MTDSRPKPGDGELGPRDKGVKDINSRQLSFMLQKVQQIVHQELQEIPTSIYVVGSFARGEAIGVASDLDLRIVINGVKPDERLREVENLIKNEYGPAITPDECGFLDPRITILEPKNETPNVKVAP